MKKELSKKSIHELRILGRSIGVKSVTTLKKEELIEQIISVDNGTQKPFLATKVAPHLKVKVKILTSTTNRLRQKLMQYYKKQKRKFWIYYLIKSTKVLFLFVKILYRG